MSILTQLMEMNSIPLIEEGVTIESDVFIK